MARTIVIIGGVAGGATAATRLRRLNEDDHIIVLEKGEYISFANCGLPYHIGGVIPNRDSLLLQTVEGINAQYGLDVRNFSEVTAIDPAAHTVTVIYRPNGDVYTQPYDELIISTGAQPIMPPIEGLVAATNVFTLRNIPDMDAIKAYIAEHDVKTATVVGGGFIGLEMTENLVDLGIKVQLVEATDQVMPNLDFEMAQILHAQLNLHGVQLVLGDALTKVSDGGTKLELASGTQLNTDLIIMAVGVRPENELAKQAGLALGQRGGIVVDEQFHTSAPNIFAIGDVIEVKDAVTGLPTQIPLAWPANRQARLVADVINGIPAAYPGTAGTSVAKVFELTAAATGNNEKQLQKAGIDYRVIHIHPNSHAGYYPGASPIALKLLFAPDGRILGAQGVGTEFVDKRIDVIATAMHFGGKAPELAALELAYAPPYSSAKDPVNMLGYYAQNVLDGLVKPIYWTDVDRLLADGALFLDVREPDELNIGSIPNSLHIPLNQLRQRLGEVPQGKPVYVYCQVGLRGYNAARILAQRGFEVYNLDGGYKTYKQANYQLKPVTPLVSTSASTPADRSTAGIGNIVDATAALKSGENVRTVEVDACGLQCPGPILKVKKAIDDISDGDRLEVKASDFGFSADIESWCKNTGNTLIDNRIDGGIVKATIAKGLGGETSGGTNSGAVVAPVGSADLPALSNGQALANRDGATIVLFSGDLDKALAAMIIASGAAAYGKPVTIFCTFWGLSVLKKEKVKKTGLAKMFDMMLPDDASHLPVSSMNMGGAGAAMIKHVMKQKNVDSLPQMMEQARDLGVKFIACTMSMDIMGVQPDELFDWVEYGGVATYIGDSEKSNLTLFI